MLVGVMRALNLLAFTEQSSFARRATSLLVCACLTGVFGWQKNSDMFISSGVMAEDYVNSLNVSCGLLQGIAWRSLQWGAWSAVGMAAANTALLKRLQRQVHFFYPRLGMHCLVMSGCIISCALR